MNAATAPPLRLKQNKMCKKYRRNHCFLPFVVLVSFGMKNASFLICIHRAAEAAIFSLDSHDKTEDDGFFFGDLVIEVDEIDDWRR